MSDGHPHICCLSDAFEQVRHGGRRYHFEYTRWGGWVPVNRDGVGVHNHPKGAWAALKQKHPEILV